MSTIQSQPLDEMRDKLTKAREHLDERFMSVEQAMNMYECMTKMQPRPPRTIIEIGTWTGTGTCLLGLMSQQWGTIVHTVDLLWTANTPNKHFKIPVEERVSYHGLSQNVVIHRYEHGSADLFEAWKNTDRVDFVYIDGDHNFRGVVLDFAMAWAALRSGGWLVFDDMNHPDHSGVDACWETVVKPIVPREHRYIREFEPHALRHGYCMRSIK